MQVKLGGIRQYVRGKAVKTAHRDKGWLYKENVWTLDFWWKFFAYYQKKSWRQKVNLLQKLFEGKACAPVHDLWGMARCSAVQNALT